MLSIVVCTLNEELYLPKLLESIKAQEGVKFEIIIVDAGSTDKTAAVAKKYQEEGLPIKFVTPENTRNIALQRNIGADNAQYELLYFIDADVLLPEGFLKKAVAEILKNKILVGGTKVYASESELKYRMKYWSYSNCYVPLVRLFKPIVLGPSIFSTKEIHYKIGGFNPRMLFEDYNYGVDASKYYRPKLLKDVSIKTSARRFYNGSLRSTMELYFAAVYFIFKTNMTNRKLLTSYYATTGNQPKPKY
jgi:glycosyltransferase involved in cell wall biosynthesis